MSRLVLDAGAYIAFERGDVTTRALLTAARRSGHSVVTTSPVVAQIWRDGRRQALTARLIAASEIDAPDVAAARRAGALLSKTKTQDVVDALVAGLARSGDTVLTSDPDDIEALVNAADIRATMTRV